MVSVMAAMLDELMGRDRNLAPGDKSRGIRWDDKRVCKHFLCGICPHELFTNTKSDLGLCDKIHDDELKEEFGKAVFYQKTQIYDDHERMIETHLREVDKRIARGHARLKLSREQNGEAAVSKFLFGGPNDEQIRMLTERINELVDQAEALGCEGKVDEARGITRLSEQLKEERFQLANQGSRIPSMIDTALREEKMMEVCEICGAFLIVGDAQSRIDDHLMGKIHMGYARLRKGLEELQEIRKKEREERDKARNDSDASRSKRREDREEHSKDTDKERGDKERGDKERGDKDKERGKDKDREKDREDRRRRRSRSRDRRDSRRDKDKRRSRSRDKEARGSGGREKERRRSRSRDRRRDRDDVKSSSRRSRSRSRDRKKEEKRDRSRSRDRGSRRDRDEKRDSKRRDRDDGTKEDRKSEDGERGKEERKPDDPLDREERSASRSERDDDGRRDDAGEGSSSKMDADDAGRGGGPVVASGSGSLLQRLRNGEGYPGYDRS